jgi:hypothetical protein
MPEPVDVIPYAQQHEPPYLVREPGRVALVMRPAPVGFRAVIGVLTCALWIGSLAYAGWIVRLWLRVPQPTPKMTGATAFFGLCAIGLAPTVFAALQWWARPSLYRPILEVARDELVFRRPGLRKVRRVPVSRVKDVRFVTARGLGGRTRVRVYVWLVNWPIPLEFWDSTPDPAWVAEAQRAFRQALGRA